MTGQKYTSEIFADDIHSIGVKNGLIRLDLVSYSASEQDENEIACLNRVTLPLEGFLNTFHVMENVLEQLRKNGVVGKEKQEKTTGRTAGQQSPNFE